MSLSIQLPFGLPAERLTTTSLLWRLDRRDGVTLGFTAHDRDLTLGSLRYRARPGLRPTRIQRSDTLEPDNVEVAGQLTDDAITDADLIAGRWDGAMLRISLLDWQQSGAVPLLLMRGSFGEVTRAGQQFRVDIIGTAAALSAPVAPRTSPTCRADFGGHDCQISLHRFRARHRLTASAADILTFAGLTSATEAGSSAPFAQGQLRWVDGALAGLRFDIAAQQGDAVQLLTIPAVPPAIGDRAELTQGCDKRFATCRDRFANVRNFRGEPHLPGNDLLTRYPSGR
jgi:uncharacterized phage protein (TIGR02218 family)